MTADKDNKDGEPSFADIYASVCRISQTPYDMIRRRVIAAREADKQKENEMEDKP